MIVISFRSRIRPGCDLQALDRLKAQGMLSEEDFQALDTGVNREVQAAVDFAEAAEWEPVESLGSEVGATSS